MREIACDAWKVDADVLAITTNGTLRGGKNVMGAGIALEAAMRLPILPKIYGDFIRAFGHHVYLMPLGMLMFPTKEDVKQPASLATIYRSLREAQTLADLYEWSTIALPRPGAGLGGLDWLTEVRPRLVEWLGDDDRFLIVSYPE